MNLKLRKMKLNFKTLLLVVLFFGLYYIIDDLYFRSFRTFINTYINQIGISHTISYLVFGIPLFAGLLFIHPFKDVFNSLGLNGSIKKALIFTILSTLPMLIGFALLFKFNAEVSLNSILISVICAAFFEELYFRGFLFGQLYRYTKLGFIPSVIAGALLFAFVHLYQSQELMELIGIFITTFLGALLFAWLYAEWNNNIWVPIFLHFFMNLFWTLFSAGENALGGYYSNIFRIMTIILVIIITVVYKRKMNIPLEVTKNTIWMKK